LVFNDIRIQDAEHLFIPNYNVIISNNPLNRSYAGGVAIAAPKGWLMLKVEVSDPESLCVVVTAPNSYSITVATTYPRPRSFINEEIITAVAKNRGNAGGILIGDFNAASHALGSRTDTNEGRHLIDKTSEHDLHWLENLSPTFICRKTGEANILDFAFGTPSLMNKIKNIWVGPDCGSDHLPLIIDIEAGTSANQQHRMKTNWRSVKDILSTAVNWDDVIDLSRPCLSEFNLDNAVNKWSAIVRNAISTSSSVIRHRNKPLRALPLDTAEAIRRRRVLTKRLKICTDPTLKENLRQDMNKMAREVRLLLQRDAVNSSKKSMEEAISTTDTGKRWRSVAPTANLERADGTFAKDIAENLEVHASRLEATHTLFNDHLVDQAYVDEVMEEERANPDLFYPKFDNQPREENATSPSSSFPLTTSNVASYIQSLKSKSAAGDDGISNFALKQLPVEALSSLTAIFNECHRVGYFPSPWKDATVAMLLKAGRSPKQSGNYRPVSLLPCPGKVFEHFLKLDYNNALLIKNVIPRLHSGFRRGRSTQENLLRLSESVSKAYKTGKCLLAAFIDIDKAFDTLWHAGIRVKMYRQGIPSRTTRLISSFLRDRKIRVKEGHLRSRSFGMGAGSPQGAISSPDIFIGYVSDAPLADGELESSSAFADDTAMWVLADTLEEAAETLQRHLKAYENWCRRWRVFPAPSKSSLVCFSKRSSDHRKKLCINILLMGDKIPVVEKAKFLGCMFDSRLLWNLHVDKLINTALPKVFLIKKVAKLKVHGDRKMIIQLYNSLVISVFDYSAIAFMNISNHLWRKLESFHARAAKILLNLPSRMSNQNAVDLLFGYCLRERLEFRAIDRFNKMKKNVSLVRDLVVDIPNYVKKGRFKSPLQIMLSIAGIDASVGCILCKTSIYHSCVKERG